jgi:hypothetical protein
MHQLSVKVMTVTMGLFGAVMFVACVVYGLLVPAIHNAALLEAVLPGFRWLTPGSLLLAVVETFLYGAFAGLVFAWLYNTVSRRLGGERIVSVVLLAAAIVVAVAGSGAAQTSGPPHRDVIVQEVFALNHRLEIAVGTVVAWKDPHFERVWFPSSGPAVTRTPTGPVTLFEAPGEYRGRFTVAGGGHGATGDVFPITVIVRKPGS